MAKKMLINVDVDESRVAIVEDGRLANLELETLAKEQLKGNVYKGIVHKVEQSFQAAFVDFGEDKQGFLPLSEVHPDLYPEGADKKAPIQEVLKPGTELLVQVIRDEIGNKGATLSTHLSLAGRYLVLISESDKSGVSRKISDEDRRRLKEVMADVTVPDGFGTIIRTAGTECEPDEIHKDLGYLSRLLEVIHKAYAEKNGAGLIFEERSLPIRAVRDYFSDDFEEVLIDDPMAYQEVQEFVGLVMPQYADLVRHYAGRVPLFIQHKIEDQIEEVFSRKVPLPSGGSIVIDSTEALVAIDVNSGRVKGEDIEETAFKTNLEAAREVARQVIIRDLGGLVIVDFIDMKDRKKVREVEQALRDAFKYDKARRKFARISEFGLLEMSRQRLKSTLMKSSFDRCHECDGLGLVRSPDSAGMYLLRRIREITASGRIHQVVVRAPIQVANFLVNRKRRELYALEVERRTLVEVHADSDLPSHQASIEIVDKKTRGKPKQTIQKVDLVRSEEVRREGEPLRRGDVIFREIPETVDFSKMYEEVSEEAEKATAAREERERRKEARKEAQRERQRDRDDRRNDQGRNTSASDDVESPGETRSWWQKLSDFFQGGTPEAVKVEEERPRAERQGRKRDGGKGGKGRENRGESRSEGRNEGRNEGRKRPSHESESGEGGDERRKRRRRRGRRGGNGEGAEGGAPEGGDTAGNDSGSGNGNGGDEQRRRRKRGRGKGEGEGRSSAGDSNGSEQDSSETGTARPAPRATTPDTGPKGESAPSKSQATAGEGSGNEANRAEGSRAASTAVKRPAPQVKETPKVPSVSSGFVIDLRGDSVPVRPPVSGKSGNTSGE